MRPVVLRSTKTSPARIKHTRWYRRASGHGRLLPLFFLPLLLLLLSPLQFAGIDSSHMLQSSQSQTEVLSTFVPSLSTSEVLEKKAVAKNPLPNERNVPTLSNTPSPPKYRTNVLSTMIPSFSTKLGKMLPFPTQVLTQVPTTIRETFVPTHATPTKLPLPTLPPAPYIPTPQQLPGIAPEIRTMVQSPIQIPTSSPYVPIYAIQQQNATQVPVSAMVSGKTLSIPIVMYHYIRDVDKTLDPLGYRLSVAPDQFAQQIAWLWQQGYTTIRMDMLADCVQGVRSCPARSVALTFDDGYMDAYTTAFPLLQQYGFVATFYVITGFVGNQGYMGWNELQALQAAGMEIGSHSISHPNLTALSQAQRDEQLLSSRQRLQEVLGTPIRSFCYPSGLFDATVQQAVRDAGYTNATTTMPGISMSNLYALPRLRISGELGQAGFEAMLGM